MGRPRYALPASDHRDHSALGRIAQLAVQQRLGLLPVGRAGLNTVDSDYLAAVWVRVARDRLSHSFQHIRFQAPARSTADRQFGDDAVERTELLLGHFAALQEMADVAHHARAL